MKTALGGADGKATPKHVAYYRRRAQGAVGLIITEPLYVDSRGKEHPKQLGIDEDAKLAGLKSVVDAVHAAGSRIFAHLNHAGRAANPKASGQVPEAPSAIACPSTGAMPEELTVARIQAIVEAFGKATARAVQAGFDGVEVQFGLGYLVAQFLSPRTNRRDDAYGQPWRFADEIASAVIDHLAPGMPWTIRLSADERVPGGLGIDDAERLAKRADTWKCAALHVVTGSACDSPAWYYQQMSMPEGVNESLALELRSHTNLPIIAAGRLGEPDRIRELLAKGIDAVALGRPLLADPDFVLKMRQGNDDGIQKCGSCLQGCLQRVKAGGAIGCIVNPEIGHEDEPWRKAGQSKHIVVVGGGPAGLQVGITAIQRGHRVTLFEKATLGGQFAACALAPGKSAMHKMHASLIARAKREGVEMHIGVEADEEKIASQNPDVVVVATGSEAAKIPVPGLESAHSGLEVLTGKVALEKRMLIVGGGLVGIETAEYLAERGVDVVVIEALDDIARDMEPITRKLSLPRLEKHGVQIHTGAKLMRVEDRQAFILRQGGEREESLGRFDSFVVAVGNRPVDRLSGALRARGVKTLVVGDAVQPADVWHATQAGYQLAITL